MTDLLSYNHETRNFDHFIGETVRGRNMMIMGTIVSIDYSTDGYGHDNAYAVLENGKRINCRRLSA